MPFGPLASFSGRLVHTNEWLVLLGGEWWLECTAERARRIAGERLVEVERRQARVREEEKRVREWMEEGEKVLGEGSGRRPAAADGDDEGEEDNIVEINEEYNEEEAEENDDDEKRGRSADALLSDKAASVKAAGGMTDAEFDAYWDKLAELEEEEERREEKKEGNQRRNDTVRHTAHDRRTEDDVEAEEDAVALPPIRSPADIYKHMQQAAAAAQQPTAPTQSAAEQKAAASHKKRVSFSSAQPAVALIDPVSTRPLRHHTHSPPPPATSLLSHTATGRSAAVTPPSSNPALASAFSGAVMERDVVDESGSGSIAALQPPVVKKKMSRFMAERLGLKVDDD